jgi:hypothetical protein
MKNVPFSPSCALDKNAAFLVKNGSFLGKNAAVLGMKHSQLTMKNVLFFVFVGQV